MKITAQMKIDLLIIHKENLLKAKTFEEYRDVHVAYIDMLIGQIDAEKQWIEATEVFINKE